MPCLVATMKAKRSDGPPVPLEETLAVLRDAAREVGVNLMVLIDGDRQGEARD
jgi:hypothetical protein